eukprot:456046_1
MSEIFGFNYGMANLMWNTYSSINLIKENILQSQNQTKMNSDYDQRHIMLITDSETTWKFLYDMNILQHVTSRVIFGSQFRNEQNSSLLFHQNIEKIKNAMSNGYTVVLLHLNRLYDSLYNVLNQRYLRIGSKQFSSISVSDEIIRVQIHPSFRFIIVSPISSAHHTSENDTEHSPIAFLNRLEKHYVPIKTLYNHHNKLLFKLKKQINRLIFNVNAFDSNQDINYFDAFAGYVPMTFDSVLIYSEHIISRKNNVAIDSQRKQNKNAKILRYAIDVLLENCHLQFLSKNDLLKYSSNIMNRNGAFNSLVDVIKYFSVTSLVPVSLITVTTYDDLTDRQDLQKYMNVANLFDEEIIVRQELQNVLLLNMKEVESSTEFESFLTTFLLNTTHTTLIIQSTNHNNDEFRHNLHIQYLIENITESTLRNRIISPNKQVVVVMYMNRLNTSSQSNQEIKLEYIQSKQWPLIFNLKWKRIHCDSILPPLVTVSDLQFESALCELVIMNVIKKIPVDATAQIRKNIKDLEKLISNNKNIGLKQTIISRLKNQTKNISTHKGSYVSFIHRQFKSNLMDLLSTDLKLCPTKHEKDYFVQLETHSRLDLVCGEDGFGCIVNRFISNLTWHNVLLDSRIVTINGVWYFANDKFEKIQSALKNATSNPPIHVTFRKLCNFQEEQDIFASLYQRVASNENNKSKLKLHIEANDDTQSNNHNSKPFSLPLMTNEQNENIRKYGMDPIQEEKQALLQQEEFESRLFAEANYVVIACVPVTKVGAGNDPSRVPKQYFLVLTVHKNHITDCKLHTVHIKNNGLDLIIQKSPKLSKLKWFEIVDIENNISNNSLYDFKLYWKNGSNESFALSPNTLRSVNLFSFIIYNVGIYCNKHTISIKPLELVELEVHGREWLDKIFNNNLLFRRINQIQQDIFTPIYKRLALNINTDNNNNNNKNNKRRLSLRIDNNATQSNTNKSFDVPLMTHEETQNIKKYMDICNVSIDNIHLLESKLMEKQRDIMRENINAFKLNENKLSDLLNNIDTSIASVKDLQKSLNQYKRHINKMASGVSQIKKKNHQLAIQDQNNTKLTSKLTEICSQLKLHAKYEQTLKNPSFKPDTEYKRSLKAVDILSTKLNLTFTDGLESMRAVKSQRDHFKTLNERFCSEACSFLNDLFMKNSRIQQTNNSNNNYKSISRNTFIGPHTPIHAILFKYDELLKHISLLHLDKFSNILSSYEKSFSKLYAHEFKQYFQWIKTTISKQSDNTNNTRMANFTTVNLLHLVNNDDIELSQSTASTIFNIEIL